MYLSLPMIGWYVFINFNSCAQLVNIVNIVNSVHWTFSKPILIKLKIELTLCIYTVVLINCYCKRANPVFLINFIDV